MDKLKKKIKFNQLIAKAAAVYHDRTAIVFENQHITYFELAKRCQTIATWLQEQGVVAGDRVAFFMPNIPDEIACYFACFQIGAIAVPLYSGLRGQDLQYALDVVTPRLIITTESFRAHLHDANKVYAYFTLDDIPTISIDEISADRVSGSKAAAIFFTSGSTARPKGVVYDGKTMLRAGKTFAEALHIQANDRVLVVGLDFNSTFFTRVLPSILRGAMLILVDEYSPEKMLAAIIKEKATVLTAVPSLAMTLLDLAERHEGFVSHVRLFGVGGDTVPAELYARCRKVLGIDLTVGIGMTECIGYAFNIPGEHYRMGSMGLPSDSTEIRIINKQGKFLAANESGQIVVRSPLMMKGYWQDRLNTRFAFKNGWLLTGDLGYLDEEGYLWFQSRLKHIVIVDGDNVAPQEVQTVLNQYPGVKGSAVVGLPDEKRGEVVVAFVALSDPEMSLTEQELIEYAAKELADFKVPRHIAFVKDFPKNNRRKIDRIKLSEMARQLWLNSLS